MATVYCFQKRKKKKKGLVWFVESHYEMFFPWPTTVCVHVCVWANMSVSLCQGHRETYIHADINVHAYTFTYLCLCVCACLCVCVCVLEDNPVIRASVLALQHLTALFYSDLYNQCHISSTTNQTKCESARARTHTGTHGGLVSSFMVPAGQSAAVSNRC